MRNRDKETNTKVRPVALFCFSKGKSSRKTIETVVNHTGTHHLAFSFILYKKSFTNAIKIFSKKIYDFNFGFGFVYFTTEMV